MAVMKWEIRAGAYYDSVVLMQLQRSLAALPGVADAGVVMATQANQDVLAATDLLPTGSNAKADDLLIVVKGETETAVLEAIAQVDDLLKQRRSSAAATDFRPRSLAAAAKAQPAAQWTLISVPGRYAADVAHEALDLGQHVFLYSDNVSLADELSLKQTAQEKGLLLMGPDCGTAIINGVGLGFANRVRRGNIGIVGASGTGIQAVTSEIHNLGGGISQAIGTGGRDLKADIGGITFLQGLTALGNDPETAVIVMISKPPAAGVAQRLLATAHSLGKPTIVYFIGDSQPAFTQVGQLQFVYSLSAAATAAIQAAQESKDMPETPAASQGYFRGLFAGGTLAYEMQVSLQKFLAPLYSNIPLRPEQQLADSQQSRQHTIVDLGEDEFTQGRLHPMMDNDLRLRRLRQETAAPDVGMILLDVVLGAGAHPNPASELAPAVATAVQQGKTVVVLLVGTDEDPQDFAAQRAAFTDAGALLFTSVKDAVHYVSAAYLGQTTVETAVALGGDSLTAINVGLESFYDSLKGQGATAVHVDWRPPAGGNEKLMAILAKMKKRP